MGTHAKDDPQVPTLPGKKRTPGWHRRKLEYRDEYGMKRVVVGAQVIQADRQGVMIIPNGPEYMRRLIPWHSVMIFDFDAELDADVYKPY